MPPLGAVAYDDVVRRRAAVAVVVAGRAPDALTVHLGQVAKVRARAVLEVQVEQHLFAPVRLRLWHRPVGGRFAQLVVVRVLSAQPHRGRRGHRGQDHDAHER